MLQYLILYASKTVFCVLLNAFNCIGGERFKYPHTTGLIINDIFLLSQDGHESMLIICEKNIHVISKYMMIVRYFLYV